MARLVSKISPTLRAGFLMTLAVMSLSSLTATPARAQARPEIFEPAPSGGSVSDPGGPEITIQLDTARARNADKSLGLALLGSAVLPGVGEAYLGENRTAKAFLMAEAGFWAGLFISYQMRESYMQSARGHVSRYGGADASGWNETMLERAAAYRASHEDAHRQDSYEMSYILSNSGRSLDMDDPNHPHWDFGSSNTPENTEHWAEYQSVMRHYRGAKVALSFAAGALVLNRVASVAHTLRAYRRTSGKGLSYRFDPLWSPEASGLRLTMTF